MVAYGERWGGKRDGAATTCCHASPTRTESHRVMLAGQPFATGCDFYVLDELKVGNRGNTCPIGAEGNVSELSSVTRQREQWLVRGSIPGGDRAGLPIAGDDEWPSTLRVKADVEDVLTPCRPGESRPGGLDSLVEGILQIGGVLVASQVCEGSEVGPVLALRIELDGLTGDEEKWRDRIVVADYAIGGLGGSSQAPVLS